MLEAIAKLIEIQRLDNLIADAEEKLSGVPEYLEKAKTEMEEAQVEFDTFKAKYDKDLKAKNEVQTGYEENKAQLEKAQKKLPEVKNNKEYEAVLKEMDVLKKNVNEAEYRILELSEAVDKYQAEDESITKKLEDAKAAYESGLKQRDEENSELTAELASNKEKREESLTGVKKSLLAKYDRVRNARNNLAVVRVEDETCTGCYIKVPPQLYVEVVKDKELLQCPNCQRFLYYRKDEEADA
jgi:predicted  nucleic acid-binding Zn-ribbon protein